MTIGPVFGTGRGLPYLDWQILKHASSAFAGATSDAHGSYGEKATYTVFTVTGVVLIKCLFGIVNVSLDDAGASNADLELGLTGDIDFYLADVTADAVIGTDIIGSMTPQAGGSGNDVVRGNIVSFDKSEIGAINGLDIIETTDVADITSGQIDWFVVWAPAEAGASIVEAGTLST